MPPPDTRSEPAERLPPPSAERQHVVLLPGLDGTGLLFQPFTEKCPPQFAVQALSYERTVGSYDGVDDRVASQLPRDRRVLIVAESFSGPIALRVAARFVDRVAGLVLVASFIRAPITSLARVVPWQVVFSVRPPAVVLRHFLLGKDCGDALVRQMQDVLKQLPAAVLAGRVRSVLTIDVAEELRRCEVPMLYISGSKDRVVGLRGIAQIRGVKPGIAHECLDAPHLVLQRAPDSSWSAIERFMAGLRMSGR